MFESGVQEQTLDNRPRDSTRNRHPSRIRSSSRSHRRSPLITYLAPFYGHFFGTWRGGLRRPDAARRGTECPGGAREARQCGPDQGAGSHRARDVEAFPLRWRNELAGLERDSRPSM